MDSSIISYLQIWLQSESGLNTIQPRSWCHNTPALVFVELGLSSPVNELQWGSPARLQSIHQDALNERLPNEASFCHQVPTSEWTTPSEFTERINVRNEPLLSSVVKYTTPLKIHPHNNGTANPISRAGLHVFTHNSL